MEELEISALKKIVRGCINGEKDSQKILYERYYSTMMGVCYRYARDRDEAKDLLHDGFLKIFRSLHKFNFSGSLEGWMRRLMINAAIDHYRKVKNLYSLTEINASKIASEEEEDDGFYSSFSPQLVMEAVQNLSPAYRTVFNLYAVEGYSHKDIAEKLNISIGTSKSNYAKARLNLMKQLSAKLKLQK